MPVEGFYSTHASLSVFDDDGVEGIKLNLLPVLLRLRENCG